MRVRRIVFAWTAIIAIGAGSRLFAIQDQSDRFLFACSVFPANTTEVELRARFGPENVTVGSVPDPNGAEGDRTEGTVLFANDAAARLESSRRAGRRSANRVLEPTAKTAAGQAGR